MALYLNDGAVVSGPIEYGVQQVVQTRTGAVVIRGLTTRFLAPGVNAQMPLQPMPVSAFLSGAGG